MHFLAVFVAGYAAYFLVALAVTAIWLRREMRR
jgi:hypothetical protein